MVDYFTRWMERWPTVHSLAQATLEEVRGGKLTSSRMDKLAAV